MEVKMEVDEVDTVVEEMEVEEEDEETMEQE